MSQEIEIEFKNLLMKDEYDKLARYLDFDHEAGIIQTNHYFETADFKLKENHAALRIREKNNLWQLTLKEPFNDGILETHDTLTEMEAASWLDGNILPKPEVARQLNHLGIDFAKLSYGGALTTERKETTYKDTIVVLDFSQYNGQHDYELEVEANSVSQGEKVFQELLTIVGIKKRQTLNKIERFYQSL